MGHSMRMIIISQRIVVLLQGKFPKNDSNKNKNNIDIKCESFREHSFVGMVKFDEIEDMVQEKRKEIQIKSTTTNNKQKCNLFVNELLNVVKECYSLID